MFFKKSLKIKLATIFLALLLLTSFVVILLSSLFLRQYYNYGKKNALVNTFDNIDSFYTEGLVYTNDDEGTDNAIDFNQSMLTSTVSDELSLKLEKISQNNDYSIIIYRDVDNYLDNYLFRTGTKLLVYTSFGSNPNSNVESSNIYSDYFNARNSDLIEEYSNDRYEMKIVNLQRLGSSFMYIDGKLKNNDHILIRASMTDIEEGVSWSNRFFLYVTLISAVVGFVFVYFVTGSFVKPISELNNMAGRMSELDFSAKYEVKTHDEIGELGNSINTLSDRLEKSLAELKAANVELKKDLELREKTDEMRKEFLSNVSHELKTPIAIIQGYAEGLLDNINEDEESRHFYSEVIVDESHKMNNIVKQIMALNQLEFGYSNVNMQHFDIVDLIRGVLTKSEILIKQKNINLVFEKKEPLYVWSDAFMAEEVFTNYFTNALNHAAGEKIIEIKTEKSEHTVRVSVFNTGNPIPDKDIEHIWDKFYKVDKARTREYGGSGVGLSIVKATMELLGQAYGVENHENGVEFWFELDYSS